MKTEIAYLRKHGEAGRLSYPQFRKLGLPLGSGAIESGIRRVINLRLKSNAFWEIKGGQATLFALIKVARPSLSPFISFISPVNSSHPDCLLSASCSSSHDFAPRFLQTDASRRRPCVSLILHLHQVG